jgi:lysozyme family protein
MADTFDLVFPELMKHEGGYQIDSTDPGNYTSGRLGVGNLVGTKYGVSAGAMSNYLGRPATVEDMQGVTQAFAKPFFRERYWNAVNADNLPLGLDYAMADMAYHSGPNRAIRNLQNTIGTQTTGNLSMADYNAITAHGNPQALAGQYIANRRTFLQGLNNYEHNKNGWNARLDNIQNKLAEWNKNSPINDWGRLHPPQVYNPQTGQFVSQEQLDILKSKVPLGDWGQVLPQHLQPLVPEQIFGDRPYGNRTAAPAYGQGDMWGYDTSRVGNDTDYLDHFSRQINTGQMPVAWDSAYDPSKFQNLANNPLSDSTFRYRQQDRFGNSLAGLLGNQNWYDPQKGVTYNPNYMDGYDALGRPIDVDNFVNSHPTFAKGGNTGGLVYQTDGTYKPANQGWFGSSNDNAWGYGGGFDRSAYGFNGTDYSTGDPQNATSAIQAAQYMNYSGGYDSSGVWRSQPDIIVYGNQQPYSGWGGSDMGVADGGYGNMGSEGGIAGGGTVGASDGGFTFGIGNQYFDASQQNMQNQYDYSQQVQQQNQQLVNQNIAGLNPSLNSGLNFAGGSVNPLMGW